MKAMGRHGEGGITRRKDGLYQVSINLPGGRRLYRYARDRKAAERLRRELVDVRENDLDPTRQTVGDFLASWLRGLREARHQRVRPRTLEHYAMIVERHLIPGVGTFPLTRLREHHVQAWLDADPAAPRTIHHHRAVLRRALNAAVRRRLIDVNPAIGVELPAADYDGARPLSVEEASRLLETSAADRLGVLWRLAIDTGLRQGELLGLAWDDADLEAGTVRITSQLQRIAGEWVRSAPKAKRSLERLALAGSTVTVLREHQRRMAAERTPAWRYFGLVFPTTKGEPHHSADVLRAFHAACDAAGIPRRRFHDLRGTTATRMRDLGIAEDVRMARFGHTTTAMARRYAQPSEAADRDAADRLARAIGG